MPGYFVSGGANCSRAPCPCALMACFRLPSVFVLWPEETSHEGPGGAQLSPVLCEDSAWGALPTEVGSRLCPACWPGRLLHPPFSFGGDVKEEVMLTVLPLHDHNYVSPVGMIAVKF